MRVCIPATNLTFFGNVVFELAKELKRKGIEPVLVVPHAAGLRKAETIEGIRVERFRYFFPARLETLAYNSGMLENFSASLLNKLLVPFFMLAFTMKVLAVSRKCDLIHAHWMPSALASIPAKKLWRKPMVLTVHGKDVKIMPRMLAKFILSNCDAVTTGHDEIASFIRAHGLGTAQIIRNIFDFGRFSRKTDTSYLRKEFDLRGEKAVVYAARLVAWKDPITFVRSAQFVLAKNKNVKFFVIGEGELRSEVERAVRELGLEKSVFITGRRSDVNAFMQLGNVFAATSNVENVFSVSIIEAMVSGMPCVITKAGDSVKVFGHNENCLLVEKENPKELAEAVLLLLSNSRLSKKLSENAKPFLERHGFSREGIMAQTIALYRKAISKGSGSTIEPKAKLKAAIL